MTLEIAVHVHYAAPMRAPAHTYDQAVEFLYRLRTAGAKFGLENARKLAALAGNPQDRLRFIHVAGTNGKGSTCAMLEAIYRTAGLRVGLFTSPHLISFRERIQVNRHWITEAAVVDRTAEIQDWIETFPSDGLPTFFEAVTIMALRHFETEQCDLVIWETGLGGRLDSTNIVTPIASVITNIDYDHQEWLGHTLEEIAREKAGIIKPGVPALTAAEQTEALSVIREAARIAGSPLAEVSPFHNTGELALSLRGAHQHTNAALAVRTVQMLGDLIPVHPELIESALRSVEWPGRLQIIERDGRRFLLDGAHNAGGARTLTAAWKQEFGAARATLIIGMLRDKDVEVLCASLSPLATRILAVPVQSERSAAPEELQVCCSRANPQARVETCPSLEHALSRAQHDSLVVITGSLYLVGEALQLLGAAPYADDQRSLNDWTPVPPPPAAPRAPARRN